MSEVIQIDAGESVPVVACWKQSFGSLPLLSCDDHYQNGEPLNVAFCNTLTGGVLGPLIPNTYLGDDIGNSRQTMISHFTNRSNANVAAYLAREASTRGGPVGNELVSLQAQAATTSAENYETNVKPVAYGRRIYLTQNSTLGLRPRMMQEGDEVCILFGGRMPFLLRCKPDHHLFICESYLHDYDHMWGMVTEAIKP